jgi:phytol kinase
MPLLPAFISTLIIALLFLRIIDFMASRGVISPQLSRKIVHIGTGPIFILCWFLFPDESLSRYIAAIVPLLITIQFFLIGVGIIKDQASVDAMSRSGDPREILKGPLLYGLVFVAVTILFWKDSLVGIISLMILCGGDGFADIVGRRVKSRQLKWTKNKTIGGTIAMFLGGFFFPGYLVQSFIRLEISM